MTSLAKLSFTVILTVFICNISFAQQKRRPAFDAVVITVEKQRIHGTIGAINGAEMVLVDGNNIAHHLDYTKIDRIKVYKKHTDIGYAAVTSALAAGAIIAGQSANDGNVATLISVGGTIGVVALSMVLHNAIHGPEASIKAKKEKIDYQSVTAKFSKFVLSDSSIKP